MSGRVWRTTAAVGGAVVGVAAAEVMTGLAVRRQRVLPAPVARDEDQPLGSLRTEGRRVDTDDGVALHVEVDEPLQGVADETPALVFVHGWTLTLDCWHYQRAAFRDTHRVVLYDQRSHGRSGRSEASHCTIDQLARDLARVIDSEAPHGPLVLVGHSMGGMTIMAFAEHFPEWVRERVAGAVLLGTSAGGVITLVPGRRGSDLVVKASPSVLSALTAVTPALEAGRRFTGGFAYELTRRMGFGGRAPADQVAFVDAMIAANPVSVFTDFYPLFTRLEMYEVLRAFRDLPTLVVAGSRDAITPVSHSRRIAELIPTAELVIFEGAGHLVMFERHRDFNRLLSALVEGVPR